MARQRAREEMKAEVRDGAVLGVPSGGNCLGVQKGGGNGVGVRALGTPGTGTEAKKEIKGKLQGRKI